MLRLNQFFFKYTFKASQNEQRYNQDDPCLATQQIFLGFSRWMEIYTKNCRKTGDAQLKFQRRKVEKLNVLRNKMFVDMQCADKKVSGSGDDCGQD